MEFVEYSSFRCRICSEEKPETAFNWRVVGVRRHRHCIACQKKISRDCYLRNKATVLARNVGRKKQALTARARLIQALKNVPCADCMNVYPYWVMHFDHVRGVKVANVSAMATREYPVKAILAEVEKCEIVCANCHATRTHVRRAKVVGSNPTGRST